MKWLIASDIHGSAIYCEQLLAAINREQPDLFILLGDILYHGPRNDLPEGYNPKKVSELLNELKNLPMCVRGNCDSEVDEMVLSFPVRADYALFCKDNLSIFATHGHIFNYDSPPKLGSRGVLLQGHTHIPGIQIRDKLYCLNPGSVSIPKENSPHSYMILENGIFLWKDLKGIEYNQIDSGDMVL